MKDIRLIAFDYDRVLTDENLNFDQRLVPLIDEIRGKGIKTGIITGRRWKFIEKMKDRFDFIVYENGFFLYHREHIKLYNEMQENIARNLKNLLLSRNVDCIFGDLLISCTFDKLELIRSMINSNEVDIVTNIDRFLVLPKGINKGTALDYVLNIFNIGRENAAVVGDGENDLPMFQRAGYPACIGNSIKILKEHSKFCSGKNYSEGTLAVLLHLREMDFRYDEKI